MFRWCHPFVEQSAKPADLNCWVRSKVVAANSEIGLWFISEEHPVKCLLFKRQSRDEGWSVGRMNSGINFSFEKPSAVYLGWKNESPSAFLPAHLSPNLEQLSLAGWVYSCLHLAVLGALWSKEHHLALLSSVVSYEPCQEELSSRHRDISCPVLLKPWLTTLRLISKPC